MYFVPQTLKPGCGPQGRIQGEAVAIAPTKTYESNFIHHDFV